VIISNRTNLAAGGSNDNIFAGSYIEFMPNDGILQFGFTDDQPVATSDNVQLDVLCGTELIASSFNPRGPGGGPPVYPDDFILSCPAPAGERIIGKARNKDASARNIWWSIMLDLV